MEFINDILKCAAQNGKKALNEADCYKILDYLGINTPKTAILRKTDHISSVLTQFPGEKAVLKILSEETLHKTDKGGVRIFKKSEGGDVFGQMIKDFPEVENFMLAQFVDCPPFTLGREILLGARFDSAFGPIMTLGFGGTDAEYFAQNIKEENRTALTTALNADFDAFVENSLIWRYCGGKARGSKAQVSKELLVSAAKKLAELMIEFSPLNEKTEFFIEEFEINPLCAGGGAITALDGVLRFKRAAFKPARPNVSKEGLESLLNPKSAAVIGVSAKKINMGRIILNNIIQAGFDRSNLFVIKEGEDEIDGVKCVADFESLPRKIDALVLSVPADSAAQTLSKCAKSGKVNGVVLITGGIGEKEGSADLSCQVENVIKEGKSLNPGFTLNGSNSLGLVSNPSKFNSLFIPKEKFTPPLGLNPNLAPSAFISQSGAFMLASLGKMEHLKPLYCVMTGNQQDATVTDYARYLIEEDKVKLLMLYIEGLKEYEGQILRQSLIKAKQKGIKTVIYMAGRTPSGQKAVMGHTASIAGNYLTAKKILQDAGAFMADSFEEFEDLCQTLSSCACKRIKNNKVFMLSNGGFETSGMADNIKPGSPIDAEVPQGALKKELCSILDKYGLSGIVDVRNPFDVTPMCPDAAAYEIIESVLKSGLYGSVLFSTIPVSPAIKTLKEEKADFLIKLAELSTKYQTPIFASVSAGGRFDYYRASGQENGLAVFDHADKAVRIIEKILQNK